MKTPRALFAAVGAALCAASAGLLAAGPPDGAQAVAAQVQAMAPLRILNGHWRGTATTQLPGGQKVEVTQTERVGDLLGGAIKLIEGRGYAADGSTSFNAFAVISYVPATGKYNLRSWAQGRMGDFPVEVRPDGFVWSIAAGPATIRYTAVVRGDEWNEVGERIAEGQPAVRFFEMSLRRLGASDWPAAGTVAPK